MRPLAAIVAVLGLGLAAVVPIAAQQEGGADPMGACLQIVQRSRMTEEGRRALRDFMRSDEAPDLMDRMMHTARAVGHGDVAAGITRMLELVEQRQSGLLEPGRPAGTP